MKSKAVIAAAVILSAVAAGAVIALVRQAQPVTVTAALDRTAGAVGDSFRYTLSVRARDNMEVVVPPLDTVLEGFLVRDRKSFVRRLPGAEVLVFRSVIARDEAGDAVIPPVKVRYRQKGEADWNEAVSRGFVLSIRSLLEREPEPQAASSITIGGDLVARGVPRGRDSESARGASRTMEVGSQLTFRVKDAPGPKAIPTVQDIVFAALFLVAGSMLIFFGLPLLYEKLFRRTLPPPTPREDAERRLKSIRPADAYAQGRAKAAYAELDSLLRDYIKRRFAMRDAELTAREFLAEVEGVQGLTAEQKRLIGDVIRLCEVVRYSAYTATQVELEELRASVKKLVAETDAIQAAVTA